MRLLRADHRREDVRVQHLPQLQHRHGHEEHEGDAQHPVQQQAAHEVLRREADAVRRLGPKDRQRRSVEADAQKQR